jgi:hypothetical protein
VRGFHNPARKTLTCGIFASSLAVLITCSSDSALQGPAITRGRFSAGSQVLTGFISKEFCIFYMISGAENKFIHA